MNTIFEQLKQMKEQEIKITEEIAKVENMKDEMIEQEVNKILSEEHEEDEEDSYCGNPANHNNGEVNGCLECGIIKNNL